jgi:hypothetical protein
MNDDLTKESRSVAALRLEGDWCYRIGKDGVTAIEPIDVSGQMAYVPWFNVWRKLTLVCKVNAAYVRVVEYAPPRNEL